jgi:hypothetical protein
MASILLNSEKPFDAAAANSFGSDVMDGGIPES